MDRLCDEILQLIFCELSDPSPLTFVSQRFYRFSHDPYVRAHYFLAHYGPVEAMYYAMGRGKVITERVLDILLTSGAHLSRYLIQVATHHYFHTQTHFIKTPWVRRVPLRVFTYFLKLGEERYGEIPWGKGEDDGSLFSTFLKENRFPPQIKSVSWETVKNLMENYKFIPFSNRDPIMSQFPLALAIEPRLLPPAVANGFSMDYKYRDFVFRKMFERPSPSSETVAGDIVENVRALCKLDPAMFLTRTVAAEVCMEAKINDIGYAALKQLDKSGDLRFELSTLVEDLLQTFLTTRSICSVPIGEILLHLFSDFPSTDVAVRLVVLVTVFLTADNLHMTTSAIRSKFESFSLTPVTKKDIFNILINPFVERYHSVLDFARVEVVAEDGTKGMTCAEIDALVEEVAVKCLELACKGRLLKRFVDGFANVKKIIANVTLQKYYLDEEALPSWEDGPDYNTYVANLCKDFLKYGMGEVHTTDSLLPEQLKKEPPRDNALVFLRMEGEAKEVADDRSVANLHQNESISDLGGITQETLTTMIRHDENIPVRSRRRIMYSYGLSDTSSKLRYPHDPMHVGKLVKNLFGARSSVTAVFMTHAVLNDNCNMLHHYLVYDSSVQSVSISLHVPVTFKHFKLLARLGRTPNFYLWHDIEVGAEFYMDENDYISKSDAARLLEMKPKVKAATPTPAIPDQSVNRNRKRPRRSAAGTVHYAVPGSDDEATGEDYRSQQETSLQLWIKHLSQLLKTETRKYNIMRKRLEKAAGPEVKVRIQRNDFVKSLTTNLRNLRKIEFESRLKFPFQDIVEHYSDEDDEEYVSRRRTKRRS